MNTTMAILKWHWSIFCHTLHSRWFSRLLSFWTRMHVMPIFVYLVCYILDSRDWKLEIIKWIPAWRSREFVNLIDRLSYNIKIKEKNNINRDNIILDLMWIEMQTTMLLKWKVSQCSVGKHLTLMKFAEGKGRFCLGVNDLQVMVSEFIQ